MSYRKSAEKAEDNKSSAWTLLAIGIIGAIVIILMITGVIPYGFYGTTRYLVYGVLCAMFVLFIVMGVVSLRNSKIFAKKAESENSLTDTMTTWCLTHLTQSQLEEGLFEDEEDDSAEETRYFERHRVLKEKIANQFVNLDDAFLENFIDEIYDKIFTE